MNAINHEFYSERFFGYFVHFIQKYFSFLVTFFILIVYNIGKKTNGFLGEMPDLIEVKVNGTAHLPYWGT